MLLDEYWNIYCKQASEDALAKEQEEDYYGPYAPSWVRDSKMRWDRNDKELREYPLGGTCRRDVQYGEQFEKIVDIIEKDSIGEDFIE